MQITEELLYDIEDYDYLDATEIEHLLNLFTLLSQESLEEACINYNHRTLVAFQNLASKYCTLDDFKLVCKVANCAIYDNITDYAMQNANWREMCDVILARDDVGDLSPQPPETAEKQQYILDHADKFTPKCINKIKQKMMPKLHAAEIAAKNAEIIHLTSELEMAQKRITELSTK